MIGRVTWRPVLGADSAVPKTTAIKMTVEHPCLLLRCSKVGEWPPTAILQRRMQMAERGRVKTVAYLGAAQVPRELAGTVVKALWRARSIPPSPGALPGLVPGYPMGRRDGCQAVKMVPLPCAWLSALLSVAIVEM